MARSSGPKWFKIRTMILSDFVEKVPLIGPQNKRLLERLEIRTIKDLLYHFPSRYQDFSRIVKISEMVGGETATVFGTLTSVKNIFTHGGKNFVKAILEDETGQLPLIWFNQPYLSRAIHRGDKIGVSGLLGFFSDRPAMTSPEYEILKDGLAPIHIGRHVPIYPETSGISSKWLRSRINVVINSLDDITETLPSKAITEENFLDLKTALKQIHFPDSQLLLDQARRRFAFEELFELSLKTTLRKAAWQRQVLAKKLDVSEVVRQKLDSFISSLPFKLTSAQNRVTEEILSDLSKTEPMNRLLEGDVGSGKTVVAAIAAYAAALNGANVLYMAPTEILAKQHYETFKALFAELDVNVNLITGGQRTEHRGQMAENRKQIFIGTHALLFRQNFDHVGLVIIDEQHRFGVEQRAKLLEKSCTKGVPHLLTMTATPIPRSLHLVLMGDLDISVIDEMPLGRKPVKTWVVPKEKRADALEWLKNLKQQAFIVCPFIEESEVETLQAVKAAKKEFEHMQKILSPLRLGLLHGKLKPAEKDKVVQNFRDGQLDVLVSTPVVEVGVDIPNATVMIIEGAERFGLASLHQLRGRVGRAGQQAYCLLFTSDENGNESRLKSLETNYNGANLAEIDLKYRGAGDIFGTMQHGLVKFKLADLSDIELTNKTRRWASEIVKNVDAYPEMKTVVKDYENYFRHLKRS